MLQFSILKSCFAVEFKEIMVEIKLSKTKLLKVSLKSLHFFILVAYVLSWALFTVVQIPAVHAINGANFVFDPGDEGNPKSANYIRTINDNFSSNGDDYDESGWNIFKVYAKDFLGLGQQPLAFNKNVTKSFNCENVNYLSDSLLDSLTGQKCHDRVPVFTFTYFCSVAGNKITADKPGDGVFYEILYAVTPSDNGDQATEFVARPTYHAFGGPVLVKKTDASDESKVTRNLLTGGNFNPKNIIEPRAGGSADDFGISDAGCRPSNQIVGETNQLRNYSKLSDEDKKGFAEAKAAGATGLGVDNDINCANSSSGPLGWIICPVVDLGTNFAKLVFDEFIGPFLEDVPVTTDPSDGSYKAWKQFRLLGNIVLVGTMLAVVYAQVRGDR